MELYLAEIRMALLYLKRLYYRNILSEIVWLVHNFFKFINNSIFYTTTVLYNIYIKNNNNYIY